LATKRDGTPGGGVGTQIMIWGAAWKLHGCSRAVQQRTEPSDAALHGCEQAGRAVQGNATSPRLTSGAWSSPRVSGVTPPGSPLNRAGTNLVSSDGAGR